MGFLTLHASSLSNSIPTTAFPAIFAPLMVKESVSWMNMLEGKENEYIKIHKNKYIERGCNKIKCDESYILQSTLVYAYIDTVIEHARNT